MTYDPATGVVHEATEAEAVANVTAALGGEVTSQPAPVEAPAAAPAPAAPAAPAAEQPELTAPAAPAAPPAAAPAATEVCENCQKDLAGENQDYVKLAFIKFRKKLCNAHYLELKRAS